MKTHPTTQTFGCLDVERRVQWLEAKGDPLSRLDTVIDGEGFHPLWVQALIKSKLLERYAVTDASVHDSQTLAELVATADGEVYADSVYRSAEAEAMLAEKQVTSQIHERAYRHRPLTAEQKGSNRQQSKIRARIEHVFGFMSQSKKGFYLRNIGRRRNAAAIGLINLIDNLARYEQIVRLKWLPRNAA